MDTRANWIYKAAKKAYRKFVWMLWLTEMILKYVSGLLLRLFIYILNLFNGTFGGSGYVTSNGNFIND
jgi:hypothetical protein